MTIRNEQPVYDEANLVALLKYDEQYELPAANEWQHSNVVTLT